MFNNFLSEKMAVDVRINFCRGDLLMSQHLLNHTNIGASLQKVGGKRMTKHMGTNFLLQSHRFGILFNIVENCDARNGFTSRTNKNNIFASFFYVYLIAVRKPVPYFLYGSSGNRDQPLLTTLPFHADKALIRVKVGKTEVGELRYS